MHIGLSVSRDVAPDDLSQKNAMVSRIDVLRRPAFQITHCLGQCGNAAGSANQLQAVKSLFATFEAAAKMAYQCLVVFAQAVDHKRRSCGQPFTHVPPLTQRHGDRGRLKARLHDPTGEHPGLVAFVVGGEDEQSAGHAPQHGGQLRNAHASFPGVFFNLRPRCRSTLATLACSRPLWPRRKSSLAEHVTRGWSAATASMQSRITRSTASSSPSTKVPIACSW